MVSNLSIFFIVVGFVITAVMPTALAVFIIRKYKASGKAFITGAAVFIISQPILRISLLKYLGNTSWFTLFQVSHTITFSIILGLSAGVFEEVGRYIGIRLFLRDKLQWKNGVVFGLGHGGIEALIFAGVNYLNQIIYSFMINSGSFNKISSAASSTALEQIQNTMINTASPYFLLGSIERVMAVILHITMSILVFYAVRSMKIRYLFYAILLHALLDSPLGILTQAGMSVWGIEGYIALITAVSIFIIIRFKTILGREKSVQI